MGEVDSHGCDVRVQVSTPSTLTDPWIDLPIYWPNKFITAGMALKPLLVYEVLGCGTVYSEEEEDIRILLLDTYSLFDFSAE